jgi:NAD+ synthase
VKISAVQFNPTVGALSLNRERILAFYKKAAAEGADLVVFPEMAVTGYPIEDLAESRHFVKAAAEARAHIIKNIKGDAAILFGCLIDNGDERKPSNGAVLFDPKSGVEQTIVKYELPNYGVFDEKRIFEAANLEDIKPITFRDNTLGIMICEDAWFPEVYSRLALSDVIISINGSPFEIGKNKTRVDVAKKRAQETFQRNTVNKPFLYVNLVGGQDELVFDGGTFLIDRNGLTQAPFFFENIKTFDVQPGHYNETTVEDSMAKLSMTVKPSGVEAIYQACVLGLRDYVAKQSFHTVVLGMSGGVDSGIVAAIAVDALGADKVHLVRLPSKFSSEGSLTDALEASDRLGTKMRTIPIEPVVDALRAAYAGAGYDWIVEKGDRPKLTGVADENIQARARGNILMAISNEEGHMLLTTGNKSEVSVGYSTLYGDMAGGFNPIKDCYKTTVWEMCHYRNEMSPNDLINKGFLGPNVEVVPDDIITKPPSAELREDQQDSDSLPPYDVLDKILSSMIEKRMSVEEIVATGIPRETVVRIRTLVDRAEYKRRQAAPGIKITSKLHGRERRFPIVNHFTGTEG